MKQGAAGADIVGSDDLIEDIQAGKINFDVLIATPNMMGLVGKVRSYSWTKRYHAKSKNRYSNHGRC